MVYNISDQTHLKEVELTQNLKTLTTLKYYNPQYIIIS